MAELTEELVADLSKIFEQATFKGMTDGVKKALKDQAFKQASSLLERGVAPGAIPQIAAVSLDTAMRRIAWGQGIRASAGADPASTPHQALWPPMGRSGPLVMSEKGPLIGGSNVGSLEWRTRMMLAGAPSTPLRLPSSVRGRGVLFDHPDSGYTEPEDRRLFPREVIAGATMSAAEQRRRAGYLPASVGIGMSSFTRPPSGPPAHLVRPYPVGEVTPGPAPLSYAPSPGWAGVGGWGGDGAPLGVGGGRGGYSVGPTLGQWAAQRWAAARGAVGGVLGPLGGAVGGAGRWAGGVLSRGISAVGGGMAAGFGSVIARGPQAIAAGMVLGLGSMVWNAAGNASALDDQLSAVARPLAGMWSRSREALLDTEMHQGPSPVFQDKQPGTPHATAPKRYSTKSKNIGQGGFGDYGAVLGGYRNPRGLFESLAKAGYGRADALSMVASAAQGIETRTNMRDEIELQKRIYGYVAPQVSGQFLHAEYLGGFGGAVGDKLGSRIEQSLAGWMGTPGFARKGQMMLQTEASMAAAFQAGGAQSFNETTFRKSVAALGAGGFSPGAALQFQRRASMSGLSAATGTGGSMGVEELWKLHILGGLDLSKGYVSPDDILSARKASQNVKGEEALARIKAMGGTGARGSLLAQEFAKLVDMPLTPDLLDASAGTGHSGFKDTASYFPGRGSRTKEQIKRAETELTDIRSDYNSAALSGSVRQSLAELKELFSKILKIIAQLAGAG